MEFINEIVDILDLLYKHGWDERNGGNLSYLLTGNEIDEVKDFKVNRTITTSFDMHDLIGKYFVVTGTGKYFKNCKKDPEHNLGIIKILKLQLFKNRI